MRNDLVRKETFALYQQDLRKLNMICCHFRWCWFKGVCVFVYIIVVSSAFLRLLTSRWNSKYNSYKTAVRWNLLHRADVSCSPQQPSAGSLTTTTVRPPTVLCPRDLPLQPSVWARPPQRSQRGGLQMTWFWGGKPLFLLLPPRRSSPGCTLHTWVSHHQLTPTLL